MAETRMSFEQLRCHQMAQITPTREMALQEIGSVDSMSQPIVLFPEGTLVLRLHSYPRNECQSFLVSSEVLKLASEVLKNRITELQSPILNIFEQDTKPLAIIIRSLHHQDNIWSAPNDLQSLAKVAIYARKCKFERAMKPWFVDQLEMIHIIADDAVSIGFELLILHIVGGEVPTKKFTKRTLRAAKLLDPFFGDIWSRTSPLDALPPFLQSVFLRPLLQNSFQLTQGR